jgi:hypothetical protein
MHLEPLLLKNTQIFLFWEPLGCLTCSGYDTCWHHWALDSDLPIVIVGLFLLTILMFKSFYYMSWEIQDSLGT